MKNFNDEKLLGLVLPHLDVVKGPDHRGEYTAWCPFHMDGQGNPPHQANLSISVRGFYCHACGEKGRLKTMAGRLGLEVNIMNSEIVATYDYQDKDGNVLYQVVRLYGKQFRQGRPDGNGGWAWNLNGVARVPYHLPELTTRRDEPVFIVEGEKDADRLAGEGFLTTTNSGGAGKWRSEYSPLLKGRDVIIIPDNDDPGRKHAMRVAHSLVGKAKSIKIIELPDLEEKGDVSDWLDMGNTIIDLNKIVESTPAWQLPNDSSVVDQRASDDQRKSISQATELMNIVLESGCELFHDEVKQPYIAVPSDSGRKQFRLDSQQFTDWLSHKAYSETGRAFGKDAIFSARQALCGKAVFDGEPRQLNVRVAREGASIWIDLDGIRAIKVTSNGWSIVAEPPILFRSYPQQKPFPDPIPGGPIRRVLDFLNIHDESAALLVLAYLVVAFVPDIPFPCLVLQGTQGSAKTTILKVIRKLIDPVQIEVRKPVRDERQFAISATQNRVLFFDNLTTIPSSFSDTLCRAVCEEGFSTRALYKNDEEVIFKYRNIIGLAGINLVASKPDLLDRSLIISLNRLPDEVRNEEQDFWTRFDKAYPYLFGSILDVLSETMKLFPGIKLRSLPRMADFSRWGAAAATALGADSDVFMLAYKRNIGRQNEAAIDASLVAQAIIAFMTDKTAWNGSPTDLLAELTSIAEQMHLDTKSRLWPKEGSWVSRRLNEVEPNLNALGIKITESRNRLQRMITIRSASQFPITKPMEGKGCDTNVTANMLRDPVAVTNAVTDPTANNPDSDES